MYAPVKGARWRFPLRGNTTALDGVGWPYRVCEGCMRRTCAYTLVYSVLMGNLILCETQGKGGRRDGGRASSPDASPLPRKQPTSPRELKGQRPRGRKGEGGLTFQLFVKRRFGETVEREAGNFSPNKSFTKGRGRRDARGATETKPNSKHGTSGAASKPQRTTPRV